MGLLSRLFRPKEHVPVDNSFVKLPVFHQTLLFPFPLSWPLEPLHRELEGGKFVLEFSPAAASAEERQQKLVIQGFNSANDDAGMNARVLLQMMKEETQRLNEAAFYYEELFSKRVSGRESVAVLMGLKARPQKDGDAQFGLYMVIEGEHDIYIVQRAWKGRPRTEEGLPMQRKELEAWLEDFKKIALLDKERMPQGVPA